MPALSTGIDEAEIEAEANCSEHEKSDSEQEKDTVLTPDTSPEQNTCQTLDTAPTVDTCSSLDRVPTQETVPTPDTKPEDINLPQTEDTGKSCMPSKGCLDKKDGVDVDKTSKLNDSSSSKPGVLEITEQKVEIPIEKLGKAAEKLCSKSSVVVIGREKSADTSKLSRNTGTCIKSTFASTLKSSAKAVSGRGTTAPRLVRALTTMAPAPKPACTRRTTAGLLITSQKLQSGNSKPIVRKTEPSRYTNKILSNI